MKGEEIYRALTQEAYVLICSPWAERRPEVECAQRHCKFCNRTIAIDAGNAGEIERLSAALCCTRCYVLAGSPKAPVNRAMVGGANLSFDEAEQVVEAIANPQRSDA